MAEVSTGMCRTCHHDALLDSKKGTWEHYVRVRHEELPCLERHFGDCGCYSLEPDPALPVHSRDVL